MYDSIVLGAGVIGVNTAYWLAKMGQKVLVVDRQAATGNEASFANGGQISVSHAEPLANARAPLKVLKGLFNGEAPLLFRPSLDIHQWRWLVSWLGQCLPEQAKKNTLLAVQMASYSRHLLQQVREEHQLDYQHRTRGVLHFYRDQLEFDAAQPVVELMQRLGCERKVIDKEQALTIEPALRWAASNIVGATYTELDESGNAHLYAQELTAVCQKMGVEFAHNTNVMGLLREGRRIHVRVNGDLGNTHLSANHIVVCMGAWSAPLLRPVGIYLNQYPAKGYSITVPLEYPENAPYVSLTDDENRLVYSRLGDQLRVAGTAELSGYSRELNARRCDMILDHARRLFPEAGGFDQARFWSGLRPATPSNLPYIEKTKFDNLWLNTGHGTLGWTTSCGSGKYLADLICSGDVTEFDRFSLV